MGNSHGGVAAINLSPREVFALDDGTVEESWSISYTIEGLTSKLELTKHIGREGKVDSVFFKLSDSVIESICPTCGFKIKIYITQTNLLRIRHFMCIAFDSILTDTKTKTIHTRDGVTSTTLFLYGSGNMGGLLVVESKTKKGDEMAYAITVAHYYTKSSGNIFSKTKTDIGFSMVARVRAFGGNLDLTVEGPAQHPASALFYMFDDVCRTGIWKPMACPHCAMNVRKQIKTLLQSNESEDSDSVPFEPRHETRRHVANHSKDIGLSVVAKIRASRGNLYITVEGPTQHPASALFYMFDDVFRSGIWKPTACPHCAMNVRKQRGKMSLVSDGEDSDSVPVGRKLVNKRGAYHGNGNGNFFERNNI